MKIIGAIALAIGVLGLLVSLSLDTTVATGDFGRRVNNIGLMTDKQNLLLLFSVVSIIGAIFFALSNKSKATLASAPHPESAELMRERTCPFCAERIKAEAIICRFCQRELKETSPPSQTVGLASTSIRLDTSSAESCIATLTALGCQVTQTENEKWKITIANSSIVNYAYSLKDLQSHTLKMANKISGPAIS